MSGYGDAVRYSVVEYAASPWTLAEVATAGGLSRDEVIVRVGEASSRIQRALRNARPRLEIDGEHVRAEAFSGLLRVPGGIEVEVAPKFLGADDPTWREDFFAIATLTHFGRLLPAEALLAQRGKRDDLATLAGRALVEMFGENQRRPIRVYRRSRSQEFSAEGDVDPESFLFPSADGFDVESLTLTRRNSYNATLQAAALALVPEVRDGDTRKHLERLVRNLGSQTVDRDAGRRRRLPGRSRCWQPAYDLSCDVLDGFGMRFGDGSALAPGFLLDTWRAWQDLVGMALRVAVGAARVSYLHGVCLGRRVFEGVEGKVTVTPDLVVTASTPFVLDAKYKGRAEDGRGHIGEADLYEALAFMRAVGTSRAALLYPAIPRRGTVPVTGACHEFERIETGGDVILGIEVDVRGISQAGGLDRFVGGIETWLEETGWLG
jgi:5-methylcytosine-specific restriction enzyme subunit McrC